MKKIGIRLAAGLLTFTIGTFAAHQLRAFLTRDHSKVPAATESTLREPEATLQDGTVYSTRLCDLVGSSRYDGKLVRIQATYNQGTDTASLSDDAACEAWLRPTCAASKDACEGIWDRVIKAEDASNSFQVIIDVIGRYKADAEDPNLNQGPGHVHVFEILELKGTKPAPRRTR